VNNTMLVAENITKIYKNNFALDDVYISVQKGQIHGLLGSNGSGKSTFLKIVSGILTFDRGSITIDGQPLSAETKSYIAFLPESNHLYEWMTVKDAVDFYSNFYDDFNYEHYKVLSNDLKMKEKQKVTELPKGIKQQFCLSLTLSREVKLFLLDEPLNGIDLLARERVISMIRKTTSPDNSIIISSHLVNEIEILLDAVTFIKDGKILFEGECEQLRFNKQESIENIYKEVMVCE